MNQEELENRNLMNRRENGPTHWRSAFMYHVGENYSDNRNNPDVVLQWKNLSQPSRSEFFLSAWVDWARYKNEFNYCVGMCGYCTEMGGVFGGRAKPRRYLHDNPVPAEFLPVGFSPIEIDRPVEIGGVGCQKMEMRMGVAEKPLTWPDTKRWQPEDLICYVESVVPGGYADILGFKAGDRTVTKEKPKNYTHSSALKLC
jgi:hypothetical protein